MTKNINLTEIIDRIFPNPLPTIQEIIDRYPARTLKQNAMVTRVAPSPTGFMHVGTLYTALVCERLAHQSDGVFYLRIEDTDKKREVPGATELVVESLYHYDIKIDEGENLTGHEDGAYGPYKQSNRADIYNAFAKLLVEQGHAYPCFCSPEENEKNHQLQEALKLRPGYYGKWAVWRDKPAADIIQALDNGQQCVIRFKSPGNIARKITAHDLIKGTKELPENDQDIVLIKSDGLPTYHFAHIIDDHFMGTTNVIRGDEWFASLPLHLQLFQTMNWQPPHYAHLAPLQKLEGTSKRKLSKRKDPEANVSFYDEQGYPKNAVIEYLLNLANSNFEDWRKANPTTSYREFPFSLERLAHASGALFDFVKLNDISKELIARYSAQEVYDHGFAWAERYDHILASMMHKFPHYTVQILDIERSGVTNIRKDITKWADLQDYISYFFDTHFNLTAQDAYAALPEYQQTDIQSIVASLIASYDENDTKEVWFNKIKVIARENGYAENTKEFKANPGNYKGTISDVVKIFRVLLTGKAQTPDLYAIMQVMGKERVVRRLSIVI